MKVAPDPPTEGLLVLNLQVNGLHLGPAAGADDFGVEVTSVQVLHRPLVSGVLQSPQLFTVATGPAPVVLHTPENERPQFAGEYWLPPGRVQEIRLNVTNGRFKHGTVTKTVKFGTNANNAATSGTITVTPSGNVDIQTQKRTGFIANAGAGLVGDLSLINSTTYLLDTAMTGTHTLKPATFNYDNNEIVVVYDAAASPTAIAALEATMGATVAYERDSGLKILRFASNMEWGGVVSKLMLFRASSLVGYAGLNPMFTSAHHDETATDDRVYEDFQHFLGDIRVPEAWDITTGSREIVVGFIDSGLDINHPDLVNNLWVNEGELPDTCDDSSPFDFVSTFDLDGDGVFTLHDLNAPSSGAALTAANDALEDCIGVRIEHTTYNAAITTADDGVFQGRDLSDVLADAVDGSDANGVVDDFFGASFHGCGDSGGCDIDGDPDPDEESTVKNHGTQMAGILGAEGDNDRNISGIMHEVRIVEARASDDFIDPSVTIDIETEGGLQSYFEAIDYLIAAGASVIVIEKGSNMTDAADWNDALAVKLGLEFELSPQVLFVTVAHNYEQDCDDVNIFCWPAEALADNAISVLATGVEDWAEGEMNGVWDDPLVVGNPATHSEGGSSHGSETIEIGAPGFIYTDGSAYMPSLGHGMLGNWFQYERDTKSATGATSAAAGVVGGAAGLALAACPSSFSSGAELAQHILDSANQAPTVSLADFVIDGRYLDVEATVDCP